jgi:hypothetical protein
MLELAAYRQLSTMNRQIVESRDRIDQQRKRVLALADVPDCRDAVALLRELQRALRQLTHRRNVHVRQLIRSHFWRVAGTVAGSTSKSAQT